MNKYTMYSTLGNFLFPILKNFFYRSLALIICIFIYASTIPLNANSLFPENHAARNSTLSCAGNLLINPGFENGFQNWTVLNQASLDNDAFSGAQAVRIAPGGNRIYQFLPATPGETYSLTAQAKTSPSGSFGTLRIKFLSGTWQPLDNYPYSSILPGSYETLGPISRTAPPGTVYIEISIHNYRQTDLLIDDVCLTDGGILPCDILAYGTLTTCNDNGTADPNDDTFTYQLSIDAIGNCGTGWTAEGQMGDYGTPGVFGPYLISDGPRNIFIQDNADPSFSSTEIIYPPAPCSSAQNICAADTLSSQAEVDAWPGCTIVEGNLVISGSDITDLSPLTTLQKVRGLFSIEDNDLLNNLSGLENLDSVGVLFIVENKQLPNLTGLHLSQTDIVSIIIYNNDNLQTINGLDNFVNTDNLEIFLNKDATSITGFNGLNTIDGNLLLQSNTTLTNLDGFSNLSEITGAFQLIGNDALEDINGFENLTTVQDNFIISSNANLKNINGFTNLSNLNLIAVAGNALLENLDVFGAIVSIGGDLNVINNPVLSDCCGLYPMLNSGGTGAVFVNGNPMSCSNEIEILNNCIPTGVDLELGLTQSNANPAQWSTYTVTATLTNTGGETATGIRVSLPKPAGVVYSGGNEWTASQGSFSVFGNEEWTVGSIAAGGSATLMVNYFLLASSSPLTYAQVVATNETDSDSTPNNGTPPFINEDDEAITGGSGPPNLTPDLTLTDLIIPNPSISAGQVLNYNFDLANIGTAAVPGSFTIKSYISTDAILSNNDVQDGIISTGNYGAGLVQNDIPGASTIPANLAVGDYYLIVKVDADEIVAESNENNNIVLQAFTVIGVPNNCSGDIELTTQAEVDAFGPCTIYNGNITIKGTGIENLQAFAGLQVLNGDLIINNQNNITDLAGLENLQNISGALSIQSNSLRDISALSNLTIIEGSFQILDARMTSLTGLENLTSTGFLFFRDLDFISDLDPLTSLTNVDGTLWLAFNQNLADIGGLSNLNHVGGLDIRNMANITDLSPLSNISGQLSGQLLILSMGGITDLEGLENITGVSGRVQITNSDQLQNIDALSHLLTAGEFLLNGNSNLTDCCGAYPLLNNNGVAGLVSVDDNSSGCSSVQEILNNCTGGPTGCAAVSITPGLGEITISGFSAPHVLIKVFRPNWTVAFECLDGACVNPLTVSGLNSGDHNVEVKLFDDSWGEICTLSQTITVSTNSNQHRNQLSGNDNRQRMAFDNIYPSPSSDQVTFDIYSKEDQTTLLDFYNQQGQSVHRMEVRLAAGQNKIELNISEWHSGIYHVIGRGNSSPAYGRFLRAWED